jgi:hypothetical protein
LRQACKAAQRTVKAHENWRSADKDYARRVDEIRAARTAAKDRGTDPDSSNMGFEEFRLKYFHQKTYPHQRVWIDVLEGREPADLHPAMTYEPGDPARVLINVPPNHGKSMTLTIEYVTYKVCTNPNIKVIVVSKTQTMAKDFLYAIKQRLTSHRLGRASGGIRWSRGLQGQGSGLDGGQDLPVRRAARHGREGPDRSGYRHGRADLWCPRRPHHRG